MTLAMDPITKAIQHTMRARELLEQALDIAQTEHKGAAVTLPLQAASTIAKVALLSLTDSDVVHDAS